MIFKALLLQHTHIRERARIHMHTHTHSPVTRPQSTIPSLFLRILFFLSFVHTQWIFCQYPTMSYTCFSLCLFIWQSCPYSSISVVRNSTYKLKESLCATLSVTFAPIIPDRIVLPWEFLFFINPYNMYHLLFFIAYW